MKKLLLTVLSLMLIVSKNVHADPVCEDVADVDQQFITDLCSMMEYQDQHLCSDGKITSLKKSMDRQSFKYFVNNRWEVTSDEVRRPVNERKSYIRLKFACFEDGLHIEELRLKYEELETLPASIEKLAHLKKLDLHYNRIRTLPEGIEKLTKLEELILSSNRFPTVHSDFLKIPNLKILDMSNNPMIGINLETIEALMQKLDLLDLNKSLPKESKRKLKERYKGSDKLIY